MNFSNNEEFLKELERDYPDMDWDGLPDLNAYPDVWHVEGMQWRRLHFFAQEARKSNNWQTKDERDIKDQIGIGFGELSLEAAEKLSAEILNLDSKWQREEFHRHNTITIDGVEIPWSDEYFGPVINDTMKIRKSKAWSAISLHLMRELRQQILDNPQEQIFPMYLP